MYSYIFFCSIYATVLQFYILRNQFVVFDLYGSIVVCNHLFVMDDLNAMRILVLYHEYFCIMHISISRIFTAIVSIICELSMFRILYEFCMFRIH